MFQVSVGDKGRIVIPAAARTEAGIEVGDQVIVRAVAEGQIMLETRSAVARRIKARFVDGDGTAGLRSSRAADLAIEERRGRRASAPGRRDREAERRRGDEILAALDLPGGTAKAS